MNEFSNTLAWLSGNTLKIYVKNALNVFGLRAVLATILYLSYICGWQVEIIYKIPNKVRTVKSSFDFDRTAKIIDYCFIYVEFTAFIQIITTAEWFYCIIWIV